MPAEKSHRYPPGLRVIAATDITDKNGNEVKAGATGVVISEVGGMIEVEFKNGTWGVYAQEIKVSDDQQIAPPTSGLRAMTEAEKELQITMLRVSQSTDYLRQHAIDFYSACLIAEELLEDTENERDDLERQLQEAYEALRFYADHHIYVSRDTPFYGRSGSVIEEDGGKRARAALSAQRKRYAPRSA
ncbi:MAG: hypothetical protein HXY40_05235 [Chloroflexi bacterium]|nr:hypothetical protein [Chloroflexota bacterium]